VNLHALKKGITIKDGTKRNKKNIPQQTKNKKLCKHKMSKGQKN